MKLEKCISNTAAGTSYNINWVIWILISTHQELAPLKHTAEKVENSSPKRQLNDSFDMNPIESQLNISRNKILRKDL